MSTKAVHRVLVANRGEIAVRVIRAAHSLGWEAVAVFSDADADALWVRMAEAAVHLGSSPAGKSYLDIDKVVEAARSSGCDVVHPGYGFLSERASFARAVTAAGLTFVGPSAEVIETMGDKAAARRTAAAAGVPVVPGSDVLSSPDAALEHATQLGYPVLVKASAGGGGRGIRFVQNPNDLAAAVSTAQSEARAAFGDDAVYLEKVIVDARHIEVQVIADRHGTVGHAFERDCSVQRRRQKLLEEAPAPDLSAALRTAMLDTSMALTRQVGYVGVGTLEYLVTGEDFYFIEMNTRIQVEHPISEQITGLDLVIEQLRIAVGEPLSFDPAHIEVTGVCFEFRINAEDPARDFFPSPGTLERFDLPGGPGVRVETGYVAGATVPPFYDSLLAKIVVHGRDRAEAIARSVQALSELQIDGVAHTRDLHLQLLRETDIAEGPVSTAWLEHYLQRE